MQAERSDAARRRAAGHGARVAGPLRKAGMLLAIGLILVPAGAQASSGGMTAPGRHHVMKLGPGARGEAVTQLQSALGIRTTGRYDSATRKAVRRFQKGHGLTPDGVAGPATLAMIGVAPGAEPAGQSRRGRPSGAMAKLAKIARCESGGNPRAISPSGRYRGKYQFDKETWESVGGTGDPAEASEAEQDRVALVLLRARGTAPWPKCGRVSG